MNLPSTDPQDDTVARWELQLELLAWAEQLYGPRTPSYRLCKPQFHDKGPQTRFTCDGRGVCAELGPKARRDWAFAVFQLAHETVHLLDPVVRGKANNLEEGVAVAFSFYVQPRYEIDIQTSEEPYVRAHALVSTLPGGHLATGRIRREVGRLSAVTAENLLGLFPDLAPDIASALTCKFPVSG